MARARRVFVWGLLGWNIDYLAGLSGRFCSTALCVLWCVEAGAVRGVGLTRCWVLRAHTVRALGACGVPPGGGFRAWSGVGGGFSVQGFVGRRWWVSGSRGGPGRMLRTAQWTRASLWL
jgi:hypothetical protein